MTFALEGAVSSINNGSEPWNEVTLNRLQRWQQRGSANIEPDDEKSVHDEMPLAKRDAANSTGLSVDSHRNGEKKTKRVEKDGILMVVTARVYGKEFRTLIDSGATRCFVTPDCCLVGGLITLPHDTFLELGNG